MPVCPTVSLDQSAVGLEVAPTVVGVEIALMAVGVKVALMAAPVDRQRTKVLNTVHPWRTCDAG